MGGVCFCVCIYSSLFSQFLEFDDTQLLWLVISKISLLKVVGSFRNSTALLTYNTMATINLGKQLLCTSPMASRAPSHLPPLQDIYDPRYGRPWNSLEDAFLISDSECDCDNPNDRLSESALLELEELPTTARTRVQSRSVASTCMYSDFPISWLDIRLIRPSRRGYQYYS